MTKTVFLMAFLVAPWSAGIAHTDEFNRVNGLRAQAGLPLLTAEATLAEAARLHAAYLDRHQRHGEAGQGISAHAQQAGREGFSGATPAERALAAGYPHRLVLENVSMGYQDTAGAVDGLMGAIYHRFSFLDLAADQMGVAVGETSRVFMLGRSDVVAMCESPPRDALFRTPVDCLGRPMQRAAYDALCRSLPAAASFEAPHPVSCPDGTRLDADFMRRTCAAPPGEARFGGDGRYYMPCGDGVRIDADWFLRACAGDVPGARYTASGSYFKICDPPREVRAEWFESYCAGLSASALYRDSLSFQRPCARRHDIRSEYLDELRQQRLAGVPEVIAWPPAGADDVPPAFFNEEPDPLPDIAVSGYPVSLQFNPVHADTVEVDAFRLFAVDDDGNSREVAVRRMDSTSDPNGVFDSYQFALFPLQRLDWGADYRVEADARVDGVARQLHWRFHTRGDEARVLTLDEADEVFRIDTGVDYWLYLPPTAEQPLTALSTRAEHHRGSQVTMQPVDANTLSVTIEAPLCDRIVLSFSDGRKATLIPGGCSG